MSSCAFLLPCPNRVTATRTTNTSSNSAPLRRHSAVPKRRRVRCTLDDDHPPPPQPAPPQTPSSASDSPRDDAPHSADADDAISADMLSDNAMISNSKSHRRQLSPESRAKISAALKGRKLSETHRQNIRKRLSGQLNPMYGKKLSAETRAKISQSLTARHNKTSTDEQQRLKQQEEQKRKAADKNDALSEENVKAWRSKAKSSKLITSYQKDEQMRKAGRKPRKPAEDFEDDEIDRVLQSVANLNAPPDQVARLQHKANLKLRGEAADPEAELPNADHDGVIGRNRVKVKVKPETRGRRKKKSKRDAELEKAKNMKQCSNCKGTGFIECPTCVVGIGVLMSRCRTCFGAGSVFCPVCHAAGFIQLVDGEKS